MEPRFVIVPVHGTLLSLFSLTVVFSVSVFTHLTTAHVYLLNSQVFLKEQDPAL